MFQFELETCYIIHFRRMSFMAFALTLNLGACSTNVYAVHLNSFAPNGYK
jgi:hypothetical protein